MITRIQRLFGFTPLPSPGFLCSCGRALCWGKAGKGKENNSLLPALLLLLLASPLSAQNIGTDLQRIVRLTPEARALDRTDGNAALDTIVLTLAYYGGMPDTARIKALLDGPTLLDLYAGNHEIRSYLLNEKLDVLLEDYSPGAALSVPMSIASPARGSFLQKLPGAELFSRDGQIDLGKIHDVFSAPPADNLSLKAAANTAKDKPAGLSTAQLVGSALAGLSDWISRRAQEELTYTFLTRLREDIQKNDLQYLFPNTNAFLPSLDLLNYKAILPSIRKAFVEDLNAVAFNLGNYLDARNAVTFRDPVIYNVFLVYRILDLKMRDVPMADILGFTYGELERMRIDTRRQIDLRVSEADTTQPGYRAIVTAFDQLVLATDVLNDRFLRAKDQLSERQFLPLLDSLENAGFDDTVFDEFLDRIDAAFLPADAARLPLKSNYWEVGANPPATGIVRAWLGGREAYRYHEAYPTLTRFDDLFGPDAITLEPGQLRAAGLTAVREILAHRNDLDVYSSQLSDLLKARQTLADMGAEIAGKARAGKQKTLSFTAAKADLLADLDAENKARPEPALRMLRKLTEEVLPETKEWRSRLTAIRTRFATWVAEQENIDSPYANKLNIKPRLTTDLPPLQPAIDDTKDAYEALHRAVKSYSINRADSLIRAYHNLGTFETVFGMAQEVFFLLSSSDKATIFADNSHLATFQTTAPARQLFAGIGRERLGRVPDTGEFSSSGVTEFLLDFGLYLSEYQTAPDGKDLRDLSERTVRRIQTVGFITSTISTLLEAPIFSTGVESEKPTSLAARFPMFADVPAVSKELNELFRLSQTGEYRYAVDNLLNLIKILDVAPTASRKELRLTKRRDKLAKLLADYKLEKDAGMEAVGLSVTPAKNLPVMGSEQNRRMIAELQSSVGTPGISTYDNKANLRKIRLLKIKGLEEELAMANAQIDRFKPGRTDRFRENLFKYGTFMADVAGADDPAGFEAALNSVALPVGSSQIKRNRPSSFELGAYFGAALSRERLVLPPGVSAPGLEDEVFGASLFVPVGVSYSRNIGGRKSVTLFGSLLDLGALTAFRLEDRNGSDGTTVDRLPEFSLTNVIAPGLHVMYNFPKSPFTLGAGVQDGPSVRKFSTAGSNEEREARSIRGMVTLSVDVPIFRFFNK